MYRRSPPKKMSRNKRVRIPYIYYYSFGSINNIIFVFSSDASLRLLNNGDWRLLIDDDDNHNDIHDDV